MPPWRAPADSGPALLKPVALPELDGGADSETVAEQLREQYAALTKALDDPDAGPLERGRAYGEMGMLFMATEYMPEAEACLEESDNELREMGYVVPERKKSKKQNATGELRLGDDVFTG